MKTLTAAQVKKLPVGTDVRLVRESTGQTGLLWVVKSGRKKMLRGVLTGHLHEIKDRQGWHYEEVDKDDENGVGKGDHQSQRRESADKAVKDSRNRG